MIRGFVWKHYNLERGDDYFGAWRWLWFFNFFFWEKELKYHSLARKDTQATEKQQTTNTENKEVSCPKLTSTQICSHNLTAQRLVKFLRPLKTASELRPHCIASSFFSFFFFWVRSVDLKIKISKVPLEQTKSLSIKCIDHNVCEF